MVRGWRYSNFQYVCKVRVPLFAAGDDQLRTSPLVEQEDGVEEIVRIYDLPDLLETAKSVDELEWRRMPLPLTG